jgi:hypothetical protein
LGVAGMTNHWLYASLIAFGLTGMMWRIQSWFDGNNIDGKLMIFSNHLFQTETNGNNCNLSIVLQIYNFSNQLISCLIDEEKTRLVIDSKTKPEFKYQQISELLVPYHLFNVSTDSITLNLTEENIFNKVIRIDAEVHLKYGAKGGEKYTVSKKIKNFVKLIKHAPNVIGVMPVIENTLITPPASEQG